MLEWAYIAGLFDGEGTVGIYRVTNGKDTKSGNTVYWTARLSICGIYRPVFAELHKQAGYGTLTTQKRQELIRTPGRWYDPKLCRQGWKWTLTHRQTIREFLMEIRPFLREKKKQVDLVLEFFSGALSGEKASRLCKEAKDFEFIGEEIHWKADTTGSRNPFAKLNEADVVRIRSRFARGESSTKIANDYHVAASCVIKIVRRHSWKHVK